MVETVFVVLYCLDYEGDLIKEIFSTLEKAQSYVKEEYPSYIVYRSDVSVLTYRPNDFDKKVGYDTIEIREIGVK